MNFQNGIFIEYCTKEEILNSISETLGNHVLVLLSSSEAADLLGISLKTVVEWKKIGLLTDFSKKNEHLKFSAAEVLSLRRMDPEERIRIYKRKKLTKI